MEEVPCEIKIRIRDNGFGISKEGILNLFMDFGRLAEQEEQQDGWAVDL